MAAERDETVRLDGVSGRPPGTRSVPRLIDPVLIGGVVVGIFLLVAGIVALARGQFGTVGLFDPTVSVGWFPHTPLLAIIEIVLGLVVLYMGTIARDTGVVTFLGVLLLVAGLVWVIEPTSFEAYLGVTRANGWQHTLVGVLLVLAGQLPPFTVGGRPPHAYG